MFAASALDWSSDQFKTGHHASDGCFRSASIEVNTPQGVFNGIQVKSLIMAQIERWRHG
jgi:hypothetical protein